MYDSIERTSPLSSPFWWRTVNKDLVCVVQNGFREANLSQHGDFDPMINTIE